MDVATRKRVAIAAPRIDVCVELCASFAFLTVEQNVLHSQARVPLTIA